MDTPRGPSQIACLLSAHARRLCVVAARAGIPEAGAATGPAAREADGPSAAQPQLGSGPRGSCTPCDTYGNGRFRASDGRSAVRDRESS